MRIKFLLSGLMTIFLSCVDTHKIEHSDTSKNSNVEIHDDLKKITDCTNGSSIQKGNNMKIELTTQVVTREYAVEKSTEFYDSKNPNTMISTRNTEDISVTIDNSKHSEVIANVKKSNVLKDGKRNLDNPVEQYFFKSGEILNDLSLQLTSEGKIDKVVNYEDVLKNWLYIKIYLDNYFVSDDENVTATLNGWTNQSDCIVKDEARFKNLIGLDLFYNRYFYGCWMDYGSSNSVTRNHVFPGLFGNAKTVLSEKMSISEKDGKKQVDFVGHLNRGDSDMDEIVHSLGMKDLDVNRLTVDLKGVYLFDDLGVIEKIDLTVEAKLTDSDFRRTYGLKVSRK